jgi:glycosyltransferase involved in cell wall biosynthesis
VRIAVAQRVCPEYIVPLFERLAREHDVEFVFSMFGAEPGFFFPAARLGGIRARRLPPMPFPLLPTRSRVVNKLSYWTHVLVLGARMAAALRPYDALIGGDFGRFEAVVAFLLTRRRGRRFGLWSDAWRWPVTRRDRLRVPLVRAMVRGADVLIAGGSRARDTLLALGGDPARTVNVYHTNVWARPLRPRPADGERFVLYVGRLEERKGVEYLVRAVAAVRRAHPDLRLKILGRGERHAALERLVTDAGLAGAVDFVGWVDHEALEPYYRGCAVFVLPSIFTADGGYEPFSNVVLEAMAYGAPVITTTANGAARDVLADGVNGRVVPDRDADALADALRDLLDDPAGAAAMARRGWETVRDGFNVDAMAARFGEALALLRGVPETARG